MSIQPGDAVSTTRAEVEAIYRSVVDGTRRVEVRLDSDLPVGVDIPSVAADLTLPLDAWRDEWKRARSIPALVAVDALVDRPRGDSVARTLVGLDVLVSMLDEFIDTASSDAHRRGVLATNTAFGSFLSFSNVPESCHGLVWEFLVECAQIPAIERSIGNRLETVEGELPTELLVTSYRVRSRDIAGFGRIPATAYEINPDSARTLVADLRTYRAHELIFDDIRDARSDIADGIETPVTWLLRTLDSPTAVAEILAYIYSRFRFIDRGNRDRLRRLERPPTDVCATIADAMDAVDESDSAVVAP